MQRGAARLAPDAGAQAGDVDGAREAHRPDEHRTRHRSIMAALYRIRSAAFL
ncbi:MAG: hypothetical protein KGZ70_07870 [Hydrogenophaga sp.]|nr:hypothetical protein [Hydrogenophaga sp.]